ncbi:MAG TPA: RNA polymerase sigma-70 factor [Flavisolibacter sp.]|nr:RNA polymerase sigma-70 factor [Flavisolibacter sp.]
MQYENEKLKILFQRIGSESDESAFAELFRDQYAKLFRFSLQYVESPEAAEEIVSDIFFKLWRYRIHLHTVNNPESYLFIGVKNQSLNYIKQYSRYKITSAEDLIQQLASTDSPPQKVELKELRLRLEQTVNELPEQCRTIFRLVKEEGVKPQQVAKILNISIRTVETQLYRAMKRLSAVVQQLKKSAGE